MACPVGPEVYRAELREPSLKPRPGLGFHALNVASQLAAEILCSSLKRMRPEAKGNKAFLGADSVWTKKQVADVRAS